MIERVKVSVLTSNGAVYGVASIEQAELHSSNLTAPKYDTVSHHRDGSEQCRSRASCVVGRSWQQDKPCPLHVNEVTTAL